MIDLLARLQTALSDRYRVQRELGRGGMATVYLAEEIRYKRLVALKVIRPELASSLGPDRFLREIETEARLQHPHILPLFDSGEIIGESADQAALLWYTMPYVRGETLRDRLRREIQLPVDDAVRITREVALALNHAHQLGIVHRDIKPENILLSEGHAMISDFGIARIFETDDRLTQTGMVLGTAQYMSPEQAAGGQVDGRSDIYSLGCVLYEMLSGEAPHGGPSAQAIIARRLTETPRPLRMVRETVPAAVEQAVTRALAKIPADRFATAGEFAAALAPSTTSSIVARPPRPVARRWLWVAGAGAVIAVAAAVVLLAPKGRATVVPSASVIAVLPLAPTEPDTDLTRLGRDLAATVSANLDGVGSIRTVDRLTIVAQTRGTAASASLEDGAALAQRLGARGVVTGSIVGRGRQVRIDFGLYATDSLRPLARGQVTGDANDVNALTDSITWVLLRQIWRGGAAPTPSLAAITTRSVPALRAFLEGEREIVESRWPTAAEAFARAIEADSTFWLAYWRFAFAKEWNFEEVDSSVVRAFRDHRNLLPEQERLLIEGETSDSFGVQLDRYRQVTERFPDNWLGWMYYADALVHWAPGLGYTNVDAKAALERTLTLNPRLLPAWEHLGWMTLTLRDTAGSARVIRALDELGASRSFQVSTGFDEFRLFRILHQAATTGSPNRVALDSLVTEIARHPDRFWQGLFPTLISSYGFPKLQIEVSQRVLRARPPADVAALHRAGIAVAWATRGAWDSALAVMDEQHAPSPGGSVALDRFGLAVAGAWLGAIDPSEAARRRPDAAAAAMSRDPSQGAELAWLDGLMGTMRRDKSAVAASREAIARTSDSMAADLATSLAAFELSMGGRRREAAEQLAKLMWRRAQGGRSEGDVHPYLGSVSRMAAARWLLQEGDTIQAARLLTWHQGWIANLRVTMANQIFSGPALLEGARIDEALGQEAAAHAGYAWFLRLYDLPSPSVRRLTEEARAAMERME